MIFDFEEKKLIKELKRIKPKKVLIQLPEGIKKRLFSISEKIEELGIECVFSGESCWGACSIDIEEAKAIGADLIIHFGHAEFLKVDFPVIYIEIKDKTRIDSLIKKALNSLNEYKNIGISYSIQHKNQIEKAIQIIKKNKKKVFISEKKGLVAYKGHIVGCQYEGLKSIKEKVDCFLIIGNQFHGLGAALAVPEKPVLLVDLYNNEIKKMDELRDKIIRQRFISIEKFKKAKKIGVLVEKKIGQKFGSPKFIREKLKKKNKKIAIIIISEITPEKLTNFYDIEAFIELACPRIATDDFFKYQKPILTLKEALVGLEEKKWEDLLKEGFV